MKSVLIGAAVSIVIATGSAYAQDAAGGAKSSDADAASLRDYVKRLEQRVSELEREKEWPPAETRGPATSALEQAVRSVNLTGYMEFIYSYNLRPGPAVPGRRGDALNFNQLRGPDADAYGFSFQNVELLADKPLTTGGSTGFHVRTSYGIDGEVAHADPNFDGGAGNNAFDVREAFMSWRAPFAPTGHADLSVGKFRTPLGFEVLENTDNWQITRNPIAVFGTPVTNTGARASVPVTETFTANVCLVNGWDDVRDANSGKTGIANLVFGRFDSVLSSQVQVNASYGTASGDVPGGDKLRFFEVVWDGKFDDETEFALDGIWGDASDHAWHGAAAYVRRHMSGKLWISGRAGWYADDAIAADGARIVDGTVAAGCDVASGLTVALEYRHDFSRSEGTYLSSSGGPAENQDTLTASFLYRF